MTLRAKQHVIRVEESEEDMYAAIDVASAKVVRQLRKFKTRVVDRRLVAEPKAAEAARKSATQAPELDIDGLMSELSADEEIVRTKIIEFPPLTQEEALI